VAAIRAQSELMAKRARMLMELCPSASSDARAVRAAVSEEIRDGLLRAAREDGLGHALESWLDKVTRELAVPGADARVSREPDTFGRETVREAEPAATIAQDYRAPSPSARKALAHGNRLRPPTIYETRGHRFESCRARSERFSGVDGPPRGTVLD